MIEAILGHSVYDEGVQWSKIIGEEDGAMKGIHKCKNSMAQGCRCRMLWEPRFADMSAALAIATPHRP